MGDRSPSGRYHRLVTTDRSAMSAPGAPRAPVTVRRATSDDLAAVVDLCATALGWAGEPRDEALFRWKHQHNSFGPSPMWVAEVDGAVVGVRAFLRWDFTRADGSVAHAVRAVDTATHPSWQGRGLFTRLTTTALGELGADGLAGDRIAFVFNTPNEQSRPGYLKMGWEVVGRVPVAVAVGGVRGLVRLPGARRPAGKWSLPTTAGDAASDVLADDGAIGELLHAAATPEGLATRRTVPFLRWRYAGGPVDYRALTLGRDPTEGVAVFRLRRRGSSTEADVVDLLVPDDDADRRRRALVAAVAAATEPDHLLVAQHRRRSGAAWRIDRLGPVLTWRAVDDRSAPAVAAWALELGDVELF